MKPQTPEEIDRYFQAAERGDVKPNAIERRVIVGEFRAIDVDGNDMLLEGHPAVFNQRADLGYFVEVVKPGAFSRTIGEDDIRALINHDSNLVIGRRGSGTLQLSEDDTGLAMRCDVSKTSYGNDLMISVRRGDITQGSIGFMARGQRVYKENDTWVRELLDCRLFDVSPVTFPAYTGTDMNVRSMADVLTSFRNGSEDPIDEESWKRQLNYRRRMLELAEF